MVTSVSRILSASAASWVRIGVTVIMQIAQVPLYLGSWDAHTYGVWLLLQARAGLGATGDRTRKRRRDAVMGEIDIRMTVHCLPQAGTT